MTFINIRNGPRRKVSFLLKNNFFLSFFTINWKNIIFLWMKNFFFFFYDIIKENLQLFGTLWSTTSIIQLKVDWLWWGLDFHAEEVGYKVNWGIELMNISKFGSYSYGDYLLGFLEYNPQIYQFYQFFYRKLASYHSNLSEKW